MHWPGAHFGDGTGRQASQQLASQWLWCQVQPSVEAQVTLPEQSGDWQVPGQGQVTQAEVTHVCPVAHCCWL